METGMPLSCLAYFREYASYVPKSPKCNNVVPLSHQRSLITKIDVSMPFSVLWFLVFSSAKIYMPIGCISTNKDTLDWILRT